MTVDTQVTTTTTKFPHTRAFLSSLAREFSTKTSTHPTSENSDSDPESDAKEDIPTNNDDLVANVIQLLDDEEEEKVKDLLKDTFGIQDESILEQNVLELMHKRRDDLANVPFLFLTPMKRPSRPTSRNSMHSYRSSRPGTPIMSPSSPLVLAFRRPSTPLVTNPTIAIPASSPTSSPTPASAIPNVLGSPSSSPLASPRFLNAKASEFRPTLVRSHSSTSILRSPSPSPDVWAHNYVPSPTLSSASLGRGSSNLAIAAPLLPEYTYTPSSTSRELLEDKDNGNSHTPPILIRQDPSRAPYDDEDDDPFSPFVVKPPPRSSARLLNVGGPPSDAETSWSVSDHSTSSPSSYDVPPPPSDDYYGYPTPNLQQYARPGYFPRTDSNPSIVTGDGFDEADFEVQESDMTPFEVLSSIFGPSFPPDTLETALERSGYDLDGAMAWLVDQALPPPPPGLLHQHQQGPAHSPLRPMGGGVMLIPRDAAYAQNRLGNNPNGRNNGNRFGMQQQKTAGGNRVCRYFLAGDCRRADCRFSHDIERALCRFWLRGQCAKGEQCEFLHNLPQHIDVQGLTAAVHRTHIDDRDRLGDQDPTPRNDFPTLGQADLRNNRRGGPFQVNHNRPLDPSRTRWAAAVKKPLQPNQPSVISRLIGSNDDPSIRSTSNGAIPRPSPRIRLRPPTLLPTLPTGEVLNKLYLEYRSRAIQLGGSRNAYLAKAGEAWRRGDGAGAKRFSREAAELNNKLSLESGKAAARLVRERARVAIEAVRSRDTSWSDDPGDRAARGRICGGELGVCLGIARAGVQHEKRLSPEERTECLLDLHGKIIFVTLLIVTDNLRGSCSSSLNISSAWRILSLARRSIQEAKILAVGRLALASVLVSAIGCLNGAIRGPNAMA